MSKAKICGIITALIALLTTVLNLLGGDVADEPNEPAAQPPAVEEVEPTPEPEDLEPEEEEDADPEPL